MAICRFFLQGTCKFGANCRNEHPVKDASRGTRNSFAPLENVNNTRARSAGRDTRDRAEHYKLSEKTIHADLTDDLPLYILSAYGPGRDAPIQLFDGFPREQSFEELRLHHYELTAQGKQQQATQEAQSLVDEARQQIRTVLNDVGGAIKYICDGENQHPNRLDLCKAKGNGPAQQTQASAFPLNSGQASAGFSGQSAMPPSFAKPQIAATFGQPSAPRPSAGFSGQGFGQTQVSTSSVSQPQVSVFGQPAAQSSPFGQASPNALGGSIYPTRPTTAFGQPSGTTGQMPATSSPFGQPFASSNVTQQQPRSNGISRNPFDAAPALDPSSPPSATGVLGRPSGATVRPLAQTSSVAGQQQQQHNPFAPAVRPTQPSAAPSSFGQASATSFAQPSAQNPPSFPTTAVLTQTANAAASRRPYVSTSSANVQKDSQSRLTSWNGRIVKYLDQHPCYMDDRKGEWQRIWFPDGPPTFTKTKDLDLEAYDEGTKENYRVTKDSGSFKDGVMPLLPPRREWCDWHI